MKEILEAGNAFEDDATGLNNIRCFNVMLDAEIYRSKHFGSAFSLVSIDLKYFAELSGTTNCATSQLLAKIGEKIKTACRRTDLIFYLGDGRFAVLRPGESQKDARQFARDAHKMLTEAIWRKSQPLHLVFTVKVLAYPNDGRSKAELIQG
jgi:diguanylate cyclase (GGDEF)-like protein